LESRKTKEERQETADQSKFALGARLSPFSHLVFPPSQTSNRAILSPQVISRHMPSPKKLVAVLEEAKRLLALEGNDYAWSSWEDEKQALSEIDGLINSLQFGVVPGDLNLRIIFAPTGPMQEVSLSSGWGNEFLLLAERFDNAMATEDPLEPLLPCTCFNEPSRELREVGSLGMDSQFGEGMLLKCPRCGQLWLRYFYENEAFSRSGRWYLGPVPVPVSNPEEVKSTLERLAWHFFGGSYFDGRIGKASGEIRL
jgi:hypothetical protein